MFSWGKICKGKSIVIFNKFLEKWYILLKKRLNGYEKNILVDWNKNSIVKL